MTTGKKILTNYRLSSLITRLRKAAQYHEGHDMVHGFTAGELDEVADVLEGLLAQSPTQGSEPIPLSSKKGAYYDQLVTLVLGGAAPKLEVADAIIQLCKDNERLAVLALRKRNG